MKMIFILLFCSSLFLNGFSQLLQTQDPVYLRADTCWQGFFPHKNQFVKFLVPGSAKLQDAYNVLVKPGVGLMMTFVDKANLDSNIPLLEAHKIWELEYWKKQVKDFKVEDCKDLYRGYNNMLVTEIELTHDNPKRTIRSCFIGVSGKDGVYVFAFSSPSKLDHELIKRFIKSIKIDEHPLNIIEERKKLIDNNL